MEFPGFYDSVLRFLEVLGHISFTGLVPVSHQKFLVDSNPLIMFYHKPSPRNPGPSRTFPQMSGDAHVASVAPRPGGC